MLKKYIFVLALNTFIIFSLCTNDKDTKKTIFKNVKEEKIQSKKDLYSEYNKNINDLLKTYKTYKTYFYSKYNDDIEFHKMKNNIEQEKAKLEFYDKQKEIKSKIDFYQNEIRQYYLLKMKNSKTISDKNQVRNNYHDTFKELNDKIDALLKDQDELKKNYNLKKKEFLKKQMEIEINQFNEKKQKYFELQKEFKTSKHEIYKKYKENKNKIIKEKIEDELLSKKNELEKIINNLSPNSVTFVTNGTRINKKFPEEGYFFDDEKIPNSDGYAEKFAELLKSKKGYFLSWKGENDDISRLNAALSFYHEIKERLEFLSFDQSIDAKTIPINLVGHSHGGNIMIMTSNLLKADGYNVQLLFTLNTPSREYQLEYDVTHIQVYAFKDVFFKIGGWDFDVWFIDFKYGGKPELKFKNALNLNLVFYLDDKTLEFYKRNYMEYYPNTNYYHQITRYIGLIENIINGKSVIGFK